MASSSSSHKRSFSEYERETFTASKNLYDAFISHRGPEVKQTVAFALYDSLEEKGIRTFLDDQELQLGDSIEPAIQNAIYSSAVQIVIFSPGYAKSPRCLNELLDMLKTKALFLPVFCDVRPSDVRFPDKGVYAPAFAQHKKKGRFSNMTLQLWKEALHSSALISGYKFSTSNDNVEMLCTKIALVVQRVVGSRFKGFPRYGEVAEDQISLYAESGASKSTSAQVKRSSLLPRDLHPVGIDSKVEYILRLLEDPQFPVIAVVGMGGLGKTFLLENVYNKIKSTFHISIWLSISKSYYVKNLQHDIALRIGLKSQIVDGAISEERSAELIHDRLQGKRCLIVLDDLWEFSTDDNLLNKLGLPAEEDCKVVVTTRNKEVAQNSKAHIYEMQTLSDKDCWELFCFYAFPDRKENRAPSHLEEVGREIVKQCGNLPLAIKTTAASLASTSRVSKWKLKHDELKKAVIPFGERDPVMDILRLSYDSLPAPLKACFAYLSFFPEDAKIDPEYLVYQWIAEGFIPAGEEQWDTAWVWLDQLARLGHLQVWEDEEFDVNHGEWLTHYCTVHDLLRDVAIHISRENKSFYSIEEASAYTSASSHLLSHGRPAYLRTLTLYKNAEITSIPENLFIAMTGLRVLDLSSTSISTLPMSVAGMILLKVVNLKDTLIEEVPECVVHLRSLLFLVIPDRCRSLPVWIKELKCLQHLECKGVCRMPKGISNMVSLRALRSDVLKLSIEENDFLRLEDLAKMSQLQEIWVSIEHEMELKMMEQGILAQLKKMRRLRIRWDGTKLPLFPENMREMKYLESLTLERFVMPSWICNLVNLRELRLLQCEYSDCPELETTMPNLVRFRLLGNGSCEKLPKVGRHLNFLSVQFFEE